MIKCALARRLCVADQVSLSAMQRNFGTKNRGRGMVQKDANLGNTFSSFLRWGVWTICNVNCNTNDCQNGTLI